MPISSNFTSVFSKDWEIDFTQCSPNGYLKYTDLCNLFQLTAAAHSETGGFSFTDMQEYNQAWVLSRMRVEISALPKWKDTVTVTTWIMNLEKSRSIRALEMTLNGKKIAEQKVFGWFSTPKSVVRMLWPCLMIIVINSPREIRLQKTLRKSIFLIL